MSAESPAAPVATGRRERNKQRMRARIFSAALSLFAEKGFEQTKVDDITERADVARGTFFNHFQHKEELVTTWSSQRLSRFEEKLRQGTPTNEDLSVALGRCMTALVEVNEEEEPGLNRVMLTSWVRAGLPITEPPRTAEVFANVIRTGLAEGRIRSDVDPVQVGYLLRDAYLGALFRWCRGDLKAEGLATELQGIVEFILPSIVSDSSAVAATK
ncbi:TetR/AcrR family transcriptional regulator [Streptomyces xanthochromogenes]|uniref:TetR family transcriptional regulator n=1 Tax=Streptomyces xanthochromogenes TaxID=67384 RepID=A0ABQ2ZZ96_9ACTN|nr:MULTISPECIES: TetR/AcrR family transcriptional regulator [Streptomyces]MYV89342.1 TetR family transcriptional regulator [Streptomyces sp. SID1034]MYV94724.1 TetR family transcriptional regulator [Streptomyces sp. SID1034]GGY27355.1 TetR family transcriptional regulator [Streptomyces xanthochromogenes]